ncbi:MAG: sigma-70 family RNA polymerase sigma factor [Bacteroidales bacterium]|nr:sigma-70 family RNA polymerase sigma factor [Bacteroidales bacterium]
MLSDDELIDKCIQSNDRQAQKELYNRYSAVMFAICLRYMPTYEDAEDALVTGFTSIFTKLNSFQNKGSFEGWMRRIMVNNAISMLRSNSKYAVTLNEDAMYDLQSPHNTIESGMNAKDIIALIRQLPTGYRSVFNLYAIEGYSYEEIAEMLNINIGTVRSQLFKARKILQDKLTEHDRK